MNIVFMGTPEFSVACLQRLIDDGHNVLGVYTQPDKPCGRGHNLTPPPVKVLAQSNNIPVFQPVTLKDEAVVEELRRIDPQLIIVVAYGKILPQSVIDLPEYGCINIHASLLPRYRGAAPIQWCVLNGEKTTGITSMQMDAGLDTGDMLIKREIEIGENETSGELHDRLSLLGAEVMSDTIKQLEAGTLSPQKQDDSASNYAPMLTKALCPIDWNDTARNIHNKVRGLSPWPVATTSYNGKNFKIHATEIISGHEGKPGEVVDNKGRLVVACGDGLLEIKILQAEGKKAMPAKDFLAGNKIETGSFLS
ncbi:MAG: methionyl-tRNA formyltransferase [Clostridiales bacterium]|nr:methionyl-tRNA formyltransferase [Clostridiales bacterium]